MRPQHLFEVYRDYIACLNAQDWTKLIGTMTDVRFVSRPAWRYRRSIERGCGWSTSAAAVRFNVPP